MSYEEVVERVKSVLPDLKVSIMTNDQDRLIDAYVKIVEALGLEK